MDFGFYYTPYTVSPSFCPLTVECVSVAPVADSEINIACDPDANVASDPLIFNFNHQDYLDGLKPGTYTHTYRVSTADADPMESNLNKEFTFDVTLTDPCDSLAINEWGLDNIVYTIGNPT